MNWFGTGPELASDCFRTETATKLPQNRGWCWLPMQLFIFWKFS